jgi:hypothetical protein
MKTADDPIAADAGLLGSGDVPLCSPVDGNPQAAINSRLDAGETFASDHALRSRMVWASTE